MQNASVNRQALYLRPDPTRVVLRPFTPGILNPTGKTHANHVIHRVLALAPEAAAAELTGVLESFQGRHRNLLAMIEARADEVAGILAAQPGVTPDLTTVQRRLLGAYFLHEYSFASAALFNPSIVAHPDQSGAPPGGCRFVLSLRALGEGHVSSLTFRAGSIAADGGVTVDPGAQLASRPAVVQRQAAANGEVLDLAFGPDEDIGERVIMPITAAHSQGIEDARFVAFTEDGQRRFLATYTAYNGAAIRSELIETTDFISFRMQPLRGTAACNKGMALFPRRIDGQYAMIGRQDNENLYLIRSDDLLCWEGGVPILQPNFAWEFVQIGNCGSPIELDEGWLLLTHGVGPMREYSIGATLLDKADPSKVLARSREPLLRPEPSERDGYVPNVLYTCGAMRHNDKIILPFAVSDSYSTFATIQIDALMRTMLG